jgi:hypothetical protein
MRKLLLGAAATAIVALQPTLAMAQVTLPSVKGSVSPTPIQVQNFGPFLILETTPCSTTTVGVPALPQTVTNTGQCIVGTATGIAPGVSPAMRFVGNVLCLDAGPGGDFASFAQNCPAGQFPVVQGLKLIKTVPRIPKCPDVYPGQVTVQTPQQGGIRTFFPLKFTPCDTTFQLEIEFACVSPAAGGVRGGVRQVRLNRYTFRVVITPDTLSWLLDAMHNQPLGVCEVPCISDEALFRLLLTQANNIANAAAALNPAVPQSLINLNNAFDVFEATIVRNTTFLSQLWQIKVDDKTGATTINPCVIFPNGVPGNLTVANFGFGIVDTIEHPCACKLIADIFCLKGQLIGRDP